MNKVFWASIVFCCINNLAIGQSKFILDSLSSKLNKPQHDTLKAEIYIQIALQYTKAEFTSNENVQIGNLNINKAISIAQAQNKKSLFVRAKIVSAMLKSSDEKGREAIRILDSLKSILQPKGANSDLAFLYIGYGRVYFALDNFSQANESYIKALEIGEKEKLDYIIMFACRGVGSTYNSVGKVKESEQYYERSLAIAKKIGDREFIMRNVHTLSHVLWDKANAIGQKNRSKEGNWTLSPTDFQTPILYAKQAYQIAETLKCPEEYEYAHCLAKFYSSFDKYDEAEVLLNKEISWLKNQPNNKQKLARAFKIMGEIKRQQDLNDEAEEYLFQALDIAEYQDDHVLLADIYWTLSVVFNTKRNYLKAYNYLKLYTEEDNKNKQNEQYQEILKVNAKLNEEKSNSQINILSKDKELRDVLLSIRNREVELQKLNVQQKQNKIISLQEKEQLLKEQRTKEIELTVKEGQIKEVEVRQQRYIRNGLIIGFAFMLILAGITYRNYQRKAKDNLLITNQKQMVEHQKQEITDSIQYAQRIQQAILPTKASIEKAFPQSFVLFKPKDIVSGDFYWFQQIENKKYVAACDCTGHGVPGALMSMVATDMLNEALVHTKNVNEILVHTNKSIKTALKQTNEDDSTRDGMDLALCCFDDKTNVLQYAGAYRPLWLIRHTELDSASVDVGEIAGQARNDGFVLTEYKATKAAIGGLTEDNQAFQSTEIQLQKGDTIYLSSDGYADQFSPKDKKLMTKRFKEILLSIQHLTMPEQEKYLAKFIEDWKGNMEQTDDVLVIGVRV